jgi:tetratricopeptide (TPR) repeat protein
MHDDLSEALRHHENGRLDLAAQLYQRILARDGDDADALHLLGVVAFQRGDYPQAVERIGRAIALNPGAAPYYCNLAEAYRMSGQLDRAAACCRTALRLRPDYPEAYNNLGMARLAQGDAADAAEQFRAALRLRPDAALFHNNLGNALRQQGKRAEAVSHFRQAVRFSPALAEAQSNIGQLLLELNQPREALHHCREAVRLRPDFPEAQNNLGNVLREQGQFAEAEACYAEALRLNPHLALTYSNMGQALQEEGHLADAITWYRQALERDPAAARTHCHLASAFEEQENYSAALTHYNLALQLEPDCAEAHNGLGFVLHEQGRYEPAVKEYKEVIRLRPEFAPGHTNLGHILEELGSFDEAQECFRAALRCDPDHAAAYGLLATMLRGKLPDDDLAAMRRLLARYHPTPAGPGLAPGKRMALHFGLAHVLDARGEYREAAEHLRRGNGLCRELSHKQGKAYDPEAHTRFVDGLIDGFSAEFFARVRGFGLETERPVFIVGLPRSGTTLTEQILASHSQVHGAGELNYLRETFEALFRLRIADCGLRIEDRSQPAAEGDPALSSNPQSAIRNPQWTDRLDATTVRQLAGWHLGRLGELDAQAARVADKMPENYLHLGLIAALFPRAKLIHCRRDLRDVAVSCWMTNFRHLYWAADPEHIVHRFREYRRLMDHWQRVLPVAVLEVDYEETVADLEGVARRLVDWVGLEWEPACLAFHETRRPVRTASVTQVRQPLYTRSVARWKHYEDDLRPIFAALGGERTGEPSARLQ